MSNKTIYVDCQAVSSSELYEFCLNAPNDKSRSVRYVVVINKNVSDYVLPKVGNVEFLRAPVSVNTMKPSSAISEAKRFLLQKEAEALMGKVKEKIEEVKPVTEEVKVKAPKKKKEVEVVEAQEVEPVVSDSEVSPDQVEDQADESGSQSTYDESGDFGSEL
jgi:hypothetical protein